MDSTTSTSLEVTPFDADALMKQTAEDALVNLHFATKELGKRAIDPTITTRGLLDIAEHSLKVSGMQKKMEPTDTAGKVVVNINLGGGKTLSFSQEQPDAIDVTPTPANMSVEAKALIDFETAPEF